MKEVLLAGQTVCLLIVASLLSSISWSLVDIRKNIDDLNANAYKVSLALDRLERSVDKAAAKISNSLSQPDLPKESSLRQPTDY